MHSVEVYFMLLGLSGLRFVGHYRRIFMCDKRCSLREYFYVWSIVGFHGLGPTEFY